MLAGAAGVPFVPWRGIVEPLIFLPAHDGILGIPAKYVDLERMLRLMQSMDVPGPYTLSWHGHMKLVGTGERYAAP